jgi:hypothetical protein
MIMKKTLFKIFPFLFLFAFAGFANAQIVQEWNIIHQP